MASQQLFFDFTADSSSRSIKFYSQLSLKVVQPCCDDRVGKGHEVDDEVQDGHEEEKLGGHLALQVSGSIYRPPLGQQSTVLGKKI